MRAIDDHWNVEEEFPRRPYYPKYSRELHRSRLAACVAVLVMAVCRRGAMTALRLRDIRPDQKRTYIEESKSGEGREVPTEQLLFDVINVWLESRKGIVRRYEEVHRRKHDDDHLFLTEDGEPITINAYTKQYNRIRMAAGLPDMNTHGIRKYGATELYQRSPLAAKESLGHRKMETTMRYAKASFEHIQEVHADAGIWEDVYRNTKADARKERKRLHNFKG